MARSLAYLLFFICMLAPAIDGEVPSSRDARMLLIFSALVFAVLDVGAALRGRPVVK